MANVETKGKIKISENGPYIVSGNIPLSEKIIIQKGHINEFKSGREFTQEGEYYLCRCGKSKNAPFCDGTHEKIKFDGTEVASKEKYADRANKIVGPELDLMDDDRCAFVRFCHREEGNVWELTSGSDNSVNRKEAIIAAGACPAGRLVAMDKTGKVIESEFLPAIEILQDPAKGVSGPIAVKGNILIESSDGQMYEIRNRVALCRCGKSRNKPFCDATHLSVNFKDK